MGGRGTLWAALAFPARGSALHSDDLHVEMTLNSRVDVANLVHAASDEVCRLAGLDEDTRMNLGLALREATVNAVKHGNRLDEAKVVVVVFDLGKGRLEVLVKDQGEGFDFRRSVDPRLPENLEKTNGRGLFLMKNFVDHVTFTHEPGVGTTVSLVKKLPRRAARRGQRDSSQG
ncbi:MAG TPA: ATP-binding protein [Candidatus Polarisedimenticolia bacterium]|nr:ATP-binding protein [Candidatus Polarisedimenticolia bacterium]